MKAMVYNDYGSPDNLELQEIEMPAFKDDGVLVKVHAASVNWHDWHFLTGTPFMARLMAGLLKPKNKILGIDMALGGTLASVAGWLGLLVFVGWLVVSKRLPVPETD